MALKAKPIWGCAETPHFHVGVPDLGKRCRFGLDLRSLNKWECRCVSALAQNHRAITPVEDEKPYTRDVESSEATEGSQNSESTGFHKDLSLLPSEFIP